MNERYKSCVKIEVAILASPSLIVLMYGPCGRKVALNLNVLKEEALDESSLKGRERSRAIVNQMNTGTASRATLGKLLRDGAAGVHMGFSERIDTILNGTELN